MIYCRPNVNSGYAYISRLLLCKVLKSRFSSGKTHNDLITDPVYDLYDHQSFYHRKHGNDIGPTGRTVYNLVYCMVNNNNLWKKTIAY